MKKQKFVTFQCDVNERSFQFRVVVCRTLKDMKAYIKRTTYANPKGVLAMFHGFRKKDINKKWPYLFELIFSEEDFGVNSISHEVTHGARFVLKHLKVPENKQEEPLATLVGSITESIFTWKQEQEK